MNEYKTIDYNNLSGVFYNAVKHLRRAVTTIQSSEARTLFATSVIVLHRYLNSAEKSVVTESNDYNGGNESLLVVSTVLFLSTKINESLASMTECILASCEALKIQPQRRNEVECSLQ